VSGVFYEPFGRPPEFIVDSISNRGCGENLAQTDSLAIVARHSMPSVMYWMT
jgi:hypothetical protein